jgi:hypothetical protein
MIRFRKMDDKGLEAELREKGIPSIHALAAAQNVGGLAFCLRRGFVLTGHNMRKGWR